MMKKFTFRGLMAPTFTAFNDDMSVNLDVIFEYAKMLESHRILGVLVNGTTGEGMSMNVNERKQTTEEWVKAVKITKQHLMVQIGGAPLPDVLELARHAEINGVGSLLCLPDLYNKPRTSTELIEYLKIVASAAPNTPILYYHIPSYTNVNIHMGQFLKESIGKIPSFSGIKFTSNALDEGVEAVHSNNGNYAVFLGADQLMVGAFALGFDSVIATTLNIFPHLGNEIFEFSRSSNIERARMSQDKLTKICSIPTKYGTWVPTMKEVMNLQSPTIQVGSVRPPLHNMSKDDVKLMQEELSKVIKKV